MDGLGRWQAGTVAQDSDACVWGGVPPDPEAMGALGGGAAVLSGLQPVPPSPQPLGRSRLSRPIHPASLSGLSS